MFGVNKLEKPPYIPRFSSRKLFCRKIRETEKEIQRLKDEGDWVKASCLGWVLRNSWWGYKRHN